MKKMSIILCSILPLIVIATLVVLYFSLNWIAKNGVETFGPKLTGTDVALASSNISLFSGKGTLKGLFVGNPEGFETESAFNAQEINVEMDLSSFFSDRFVIKKMVVNAPEITYEVGAQSSNIKTILHNAQSFTGESRSGKGGPQSSKKKGERHFQINSFVVKNGKINMSSTLLNGKKVSVSLGEIHLKNIGAGKEGQTVSEVFEEILGVMNTAVSGSVAGPERTYRAKAQRAVEDVKGLLKDKLNKFFGK